MRYHDITTADMKNGDGLRTVLWVSGCNHFCAECQNPITWNPDDGILFDEEAEMEIYEAVDEDYCAGLTISGGDPMYPQNRSCIHAFLKRYRMRYGNRKTVWMYTGYTLAEIIDEPLLKYVDVIVDGEYQKDRRNTQRQWCGSENQIVWRRIGDKWEADPPMYSVDNPEHIGCDKGE